MKANIFWIPRWLNGRSKAPIGPTYTSVARFAEDGETWPSTSWSVVATFSNPTRELEHVAEVRFLSKDAPSNRLVVGQSFDLYEGGKKVAKVVLK